jgi:hypothetical protein
MDVNFKDKLEERNQNAGGVAILLVFVACGLFLFSPGEAFMTFAIRTWLHLDRIQMWLFSILASFAIYGGLRLGFGAKRCTTAYLILCVVISVAFIVAKFGLHEAVWTNWTIAVFTQVDAR